MKYKCCEKFNTELKDDNLLTVLKDKVFIMSDGGHGGCVEISHCPFCGTKLVTEEVKQRRERVQAQLRMTDRNNVAFNDHLYDINDPKRRGE